MRGQTGCKRSKTTGAVSRLLCTYPSTPSPTPTRYPHHHPRRHQHLLLRTGLTHPRPLSLNTDASFTPQTHRVKISLLPHPSFLGTVSQRLRNRLERRPTAQGLDGLPLLGSLLPGLLVAPGRFRVGANRCCRLVADGDVTALPPLALLLRTRRACEQLHTMDRLRPRSSGS